jgi:hypothetical protein
MNLLALLLVVAVAGQEWEDTVTEGLLKAQADLALGHEFFEMNIIASRDQLSVYVQRDSSDLINSHIDAYAELKVIANETNAAIDALPWTPETRDCITAVANRWQIQISRAGQGLSQCMFVPVRSEKNN